MESTQPRVFIFIERKTHKKLEKLLAHHIYSLPILSLLTAFTKPADSGGQATQSDGLRCAGGGREGAVGTSDMSFHRDSNIRPFNHVVF